MYLLCIYSYMHMAASSTWGVCVAPWQVAVQYIGSPAIVRTRTGRQQCTHSARTVHAHSARARNVANSAEKGL